MTTDSNDVSDLSFEMGNKDRRRIAWHIRDNYSPDGFGVTELATQFDLAPPEVHRHLSRLAKVGAVRKVMNGRYITTNSYNLMGIMSKGIQFITKNNSFFNEHDLFHLPRKFLSRISDISEMTIETDHRRFLDMGIAHIESAEKYIWMISERLLFMLASSTYIELLKKRADEGLDIRLIAPIQKIDESKFKVKLQSPIHIGVMVCDKSAAISFPLPDGTANQSSFLNGTDSNSIDWVSDIFLHYWKLARNPNHDMSD